MKKLKFDAAALTDAGILKKINEDAYLCKLVDAKEYYAGIFAVADGVGGLEKGEISSQIAISDIKNWWEIEFKKHYQDINYLIRSLQNNFQITNRKIIEYGRNNGLKLATTLTALLLYKNQSIIVHTGDSRVYRLRKHLFSKCEQLSVDHSCLIQKNVNNQLIYKNVLTECLGNKEECEQFVAIDDIEKEDIFIVCSDGIYKTLDEKEMKKVIRKNKKNLSQSCEILVDMAKQKGERDNISIIILRAFC